MSSYTSYLVSKAYMFDIFDDDAQPKTRNGTVASAQILNRVGSNLNHVTAGLLDAVNFLGHPVTSTSTGLILKLNVPPFCTHTNFWFLATGDTNSGAGSPRFIQVKINDGTTNNYIWANNISTGDYSATIGNHTFSTAQWQACVGVNDGPQYTAHAIRVMDAPVATWTDRQADFLIQPDVTVWSAFYQFIPAQQLVVP